MNLPGHLAVAHLVARRRGPVRFDRLALVTLGALLPDLIDKPLMFAGVTPYGRTVGHSLVFWAFALSLWMAAAGRRTPRSAGLGLVVAGGVSHLFVDLVDDVVEGFQSSGFAFSAWAGWPVTNPDMWSWRVAPLFDVPRRTEMTTALEIATVLGVCLALAARRSPG